MYGGTTETLKTRDTGRGEIKAEDWASIGTGAGDCQRSSRKQGRTGAERGRLAVVTDSTRQFRGDYGLSEEEQQSRPECKAEASDGTA